MTTTHRNPRALLLAEDREVLATLSRALEARGFDVLTASDGQRGLALLLDAILDLDVLVTDLDLPGRDGASLVHLVRGAGGERELPIVVRAAGLSGRDRAALLALGADAVVRSDAGPEETVAAAARLATRPAHLRAACVAVRTAFATARGWARPALPALAS